MARERIYREFTMPPDMMVHRHSTERGIMGLDVRAGDVIVRVPIDALRPTQTSVGMRSVKRKQLKIRDRGQRGLDKVLRARPIPAVRGPGGELFIIDHHHFGLALWQADVSDVYARVIADRSRVSQPVFWRRMEADGRLYPFDERGERIRYDRLPAHLSELRHDPYRDIAWQVREAGGFEKSPIPYAEFRWANFFRERIPLARVRGDFDAAVGRAKRLSRCRSAADLPGYLGRDN